MFSCVTDLMPLKGTLQISYFTKQTLELMKPVAVCDPQVPGRGSNVRAERKQLQF